MADDAFNVHAAFCSACGSILPTLSNKGGITCYRCKKEFSPQIFVDVMQTEYTIHFNSFKDEDRKELKKSKKKSKVVEPEGPVVERKCPKCNNDHMSYTTLQLRSADEGQTVFYTCTACKYKETENS